MSHTPKYLQFVVADYAILKRKHCEGVHNPFQVDKLDSILIRIHCNNFSNPTLKPGEQEETITVISLPLSAGISSTSANA